ncbi:MAG: hypothetical protein WA840_03630 [Caulobacteraceae bacterium]
MAKLFQGALECSLVLAPREPGLTYQELVEVGRRCGLKDGEMNDVLHRATNYAEGSRRILPDKGTLELFVLREDPELRNFDALDYVLTEMNGQMAETGGQAARLDRDVLVERGVVRGLPRNDVDASITLLVWAEVWVEKDGILRSRHGNAYKPLPTEQRDQPGGHRQIYQRESRRQAYAAVQDIIARRSDGRPAQAEPLDAFAEQLDYLGYASFRLWWTQMVRELRQLQPERAPVATCVNAAALVEGCLTFVVRHARDRDLAVFRRSEFERDAKSWKIDDLVASAASGGEGAILDAQARARADQLIRTRQRIHAGRMLSDFPAGPPDLKPEEARDAKATADLVVRAVLEWLHKFPSAPSPNGVR